MAWICDNFLRNGEKSGIGKGRIIIDSYPVGTVVNREKTKINLPKPYCLRTKVKDDGNIQIMLATGRTE